MYSYIYIGKYDNIINNHNYQHLCQNLCQTGISPAWLQFSEPGCDATSDGLWYGCAGAPKPLVV